MNLSTIIKISNSFTDETVSDDYALRYANEVVAMLNTKYSLSLPFIANSADQYTSISESWQYRLFGNWVSYGVKMNDSSLQEAMEYKQKFFDAFQEFGEMYLRTNDDGEYTEMDGQFINNKNGSIYRLDTSNAIDLGWFGRNR